jgi:hypothetical protein
VQWRSKLTNERAAIEAHLDQLHHCKSTLKTERCITIDLTTVRAQVRDVASAINRDGAPQPAFARANQNVAVAAALLDTLPTPFTDKVDMVYRQLKEILGIAATRQVESSFQHQAEISSRVWAALRTADRRLP